MKVASARRLCFAAQVCFRFSFKDVLRSDSRRYFECVFHNIVTFSYFRFKLKYIGHIYMAAFITAMRRPYRATQGKDYCNITADSVTQKCIMLITTINKYIHKPF